MNATPGHHDDQPELDVCADIHAAFRAVMAAEPKPEYYRLLPSLITRYRTATADQPRSQAMPTGKTVELIQPVLGLNPFVLIQLRPDEEDPDALKIGIEFGGGLSTEDVASALRLVLEEMEPAEVTA